MLFLSVRLMRARARRTYAGYNEFALRCFAIYCISLFVILAAAAAGPSNIFSELTHVCTLGMETKNNTEDETMRIFKMDLC